MNLNLTIDKDYKTAAKIVKLIVQVLATIAVTMAAFTQLSQKDDFSVIVGIAILLCLFVFWFVKIVRWIRFGVAKLGEIEEKDKKEAA